MTATPALQELIATELAMPVPAPLAAIGEAARRRHGPAVAAVLIYGSCLRDGDDDGKIVDLYLLVDDYRSIHANPLSRLLNAWLPPNVYYLQTPFAGRIVRAKYAIVSLGQFERLVAPATFHSYFWARFAQPAALSWARNDAIAARVAAALAQAVETLIDSARPLGRPDDDDEAVWVRAFSLTYGSELRSERPERAREVWAAGAPRYRRIGEILRITSGGDAGAARAGRRRWRLRRAVGKGLSVLRLIKAAFTFADGPAYLAWKISRHSGVEVTLTPWQQRHPLLAAPTLFWRLYRKGAFR